MNDEAFAVLLHAEPKLDYWIEILCFGTEEKREKRILFTKSKGGERV